MSIADSILGRGALDERFTDWETARSFVIFDTIVNNPRLSDETKVKLQQIEQVAYDTHHGQWTESETTEIARYYNTLRNSFPSVTDDQRFLAIYEAADSVKAAESSVGAEDFTIPPTVKLGGILIALFGLGFLALKE